MSNSNKTKVSPVACATRLGSSVAFRRGYEDYMKDKPFNYDLTSKRDSIDYTRGRAFAVWCKLNKSPRAVWRDGVAANTVVSRIVLAIRGEFVI